MDVGALPLRMGRDLPLEMCFPTRFTTPNLVILGQTVRANYGDPPEKNLTPGVPPFKVTHFH